MQFTCLFLAAIAGLNSAAQPLYEREDLNLGPAHLYAVARNANDKLSDIPIFSDGITMNVGDYRVMNSTKYAPVLVTLKQRNGTVSVNPDTTGLSISPGWSDMILVEAINDGQLTGGANVSPIHEDPENSSWYYASWDYIDDTLVIVDYYEGEKGSWEGAAPTAVDGVYEVRTYWDEKKPGENAIPMTLKVKPIANATKLHK